MDAAGNHEQRRLSHVYGDAFYEHVAESSYRSARKYVSLLWRLYKPLSVVDLGCGRGTWLKAFKEAGAEILVGYDGPWNSQRKLVDQTIKFIEADLNNILEMIGGSRYELAISLEVAEHLQPSSSSSFVKALTTLSDAVMFSAAYEFQGGANHINEQKHTYWAARFSEHGYAPHDLFRPVFWGDADVDVWYRQNTFFYVKTSSQLAQTLAASGHAPVTNVGLMNCIHPDLYDEKMRATPRQLLLSAALRSLPRSVQPIARRIKNSVGL